MDTQSILKIIIRAQDEASSTIEDVGKKAGGLSEMLGHSFANAAVISAVGLAALTGEAVLSVKAFTDHQNILAQTDAVLKSTASQFNQSGVAVAAHSVQVGISTKEHEKLQKQLDAATYSLKIATDNWDAHAKHTAAAADQYQHAKDKVAALQAELGKTTTVMMGGSGLSGAIQITKDQVIALSEKMQNLTTYSKDQVLESENLLLTFTKISKDIFPQTTQTVLDVATAMHEDLKSASIQVGKALQDPATGMSALHRIGVNFTKSQIDTAKAMEATGNIAGAQALILKELGAEFGGSAAAQAGTFDGQMAQLKNTMNDINITIGSFIVKALLPVLQKFGDVAKAINGVVSEGKPLSTLTKTLEQDFGSFGKVAGQVITYFANNKDALTALAGVIGGILAIAIGAAVVAMASFVIAALPVLLIAAAIGAAAALIITHWQDIGKFFTKVKDEVVTAFNNFKTSVSTTVQNVITFFKRLPDEIGQFISDLFLVKIPYAIGYIAGWLSAEIPKMIEGVITYFQQLPPRTGQTLTDTYNGIVKKFTEAWKWLTTNISKWPADIQAFITSIPGIFQQVFEDAKKWVEQKMQDMFNSVTGWINKIKDTIKGIEDAIGKVVSAAGKGFSAGQQSVPQYEDGGYVPKTGLAVVHQGEFVLSKSMLSGQSSTPSQISNVTNNKTPINIYATISDGIDINMLGNKIAFAMANSR